MRNSVMRQLMRHSADNGGLAVIPPRPLDPRALGHTAAASVAADQQARRQHLAIVQRDLDFAAKRQLRDNFSPCHVVDAVLRCDSI